MDIQKSRDLLDSKLASNEEYQNSSLQIIRQNAIGKILLPTGSGKTRIESLAILEDIWEKENCGQKGVYAFAAHRLSLIEQLLEDFYEMSKDVNVDNIDFILNGSFNGCYGYITKKGISSPGVFKTAQYDFGPKNAIIDYVKSANFERGRHCVIFTTYQSIDNLSKIDHVDLAVFDEAHEICEKGNYKNLFETIQGKSVADLILKKIYFTATHRETSIANNNDANSMRGMNNKEKFGDILYEMVPSEAITRDLISQPRILHADVEYNTDKAGVAKEELYNNARMRIKAIKEIYFYHESSIRQTSSTPENINAKIMMRLRGAGEINAMYNDKEFVEWCKFNNIKYFAATSKHGLWSNGKHVKNRKSFLNELSNLEDKDRAIIMQYEILTTGIDLPNLTAVWGWGEINAISLAQFCGRAARLHPEDRKARYLTGARPEIKPYFDIILTPFFMGDDTSKVCEVMLKKLYDIYGTLPYIIDPISITNTKDENEEENFNSATEDLNGKSGSVADIKCVIKNFRLEKKLNKIMEESLKELEELL